jgi:hypothetical protein
VYLRSGFDIEFIVTMILRSIKPFISHRTPRIHTLTRLRHLHTSCTVYLNPPIDTLPGPTRPTPKVKKPSPYRLLTPISFLSSFAPLHVSGWRLVPLKLASRSDTVKGEGKAEAGRGDLQDRKLLRVYGFDEYSEVLSFIAKLGETIAAQDVRYVLALMIRLMLGDCSIIQRLL